MLKRLEVLMSAFACEPHTGSEPEIGWQWGLQMARFHNLTVLTREAHKESIEKELRTLRDKQPIPQFIYLSEPAGLMIIYKRFKTYRTNNFFWQRSAWRAINRLTAHRKFDLLHHITYGSYRFGTAIWGHDIPTVWGPVGGLRSLPLELLPWNHIPSLVNEGFRMLNNLLQDGPFHTFLRRARQSSITLTSTLGGQQMLLKRGCESRLMLAIGMAVAQIPPPKPKVVGNSLRLLFVGRLTAVKGIDLAIEAIAATKAIANLTIIGDGDYRRKSQRLVSRLGISHKVIFKGYVPSAELLASYADYDLFLFPSLHETGGFAVIEAMSRGLPVICLDTGSLQALVRDNTGVKVPLESRRSIIMGLARAIEFYFERPDLITEHGRNGYEVIRNEFDWKDRALLMNRIYEQAAQKSGRG